MSLEKIISNINFVIRKFNIFGQGIMYKKYTPSFSNEKRIFESELINDDRCSYREYGKRCPLPGTISSSVRKGGAWYCFAHSINTNGKSAHEILLFNEKNFDLIIHSRKCNKLVCDICSSLKKLNQ